MTQLFHGYLLTDGEIGLQKDSHYMELPQKLLKDLVTSICCNSQPFTTNSIASNNLDIF